MPFQLIYISVASRDFRESQLDDILRQSRANNLKHDITGCLVYKNREFLQILEGPKKDVLQLFENITEDLRNRMVNKLWSQDNVPRSFNEWSMAYVDLDQEEKGFDKLRDLVDSTSLQKEASIVRKLFAEIAKILIKK